MSNHGKPILHRFLRQPNMHSDIYHRVGNRFNPLKNTYTILEDANSNRKLHLIGTTNSSTFLAYRTKLLMEDVSPDVLYVQTDPIWWNYARVVQAENQEEFNLISTNFGKQPYVFENHFRGVLWRMRCYIWFMAMKHLMRFPTSFNFFKPGLQMKFALDFASQNDKSIVFGGMEFNKETLDALKIQTEMYPIIPLWRCRQYLKSQSSWASQYQDFYRVLHARGGQAFSQSLDRSRVNFMVQIFNRLAPKQKKIIIDQKDQSLFRKIYNLKGKNIVAIVNQWHMQGIETHWRRATNTELTDDNLSPVADMDIDGIQDAKLINNFLRNYTSKIGKTEPATWQDYSLNYHKEGFQYERTRHTHHNSHQDIPDPGQQSSKSH